MKLKNHLFCIIKIMNINNIKNLQCIIINKVYKY